MSESELSDAPSNEVPPDSEIISALRREVTKAAKGPLEEYTVSRIRKAAEQSLGLPESFFKGDEKWKARSKTIIDEQVEKENANEDAPIPSKPIKQSKGTESIPKRPTKRPSPIESQRPRKKQKVESDEETSALSSPPDDSEEGYSEQEKPRKPQKDKKKPSVTKSTPKAKAKSKPQPQPQPKQASKETSTKEAEDAEDQGAGSESELSVLIDDEPPSKKSRSKSKSAETTSKKSQTSTTKSKPKSSNETTPDQEEIKKLQSWLVKCGIRKVWGVELKPFETSKAKIKHLRDMLTEVGMTGRYSTEKAASIKEARELAADIEAVQEGNERWGKSEDEGDGENGDSKGRGARRLVRGAKNYDFLSSDGEETD